MKKIYLITAILTLPALCQGATYYASAVGSGAADGSSAANACIGFADTDCTPSPGDTVYVCGAFGATTFNTAGTDNTNRIYYDGMCPGGTTGSFTGTITAGASADWLTFRQIDMSSASGACAFINGADGVVFDEFVTDTCAAACFNLATAADADGFSLLNGSVSNCGAGGLTLVDTTAAAVDWSGMTISNVDWDTCDTVTDATDRGCIRLTIGAAAPDTTTITDLVITENNFTDCDGVEGVPCIDVGWQTVAAGGARRAAVVNPVITRNTTLGTENYGGMMLKHASNPTVEWNDFSHNTGNNGGMVLFYLTGGSVKRNDCSYNTPTTIDGGGIDLDHGNYGVTVEENTCGWNLGLEAATNSGYGIMVLDSESNTIRNNYLPGNKYGFYLGEEAAVTGVNTVIKNTVPDSVLDAIYISTNMATALYDLDSNIFAGSGRYGVNNVGNVEQVSARNFYYDNTSGNVFQQTLGVTDRLIDPKLTTTGRLKESSPARGACPSTTHFGSDCGAYTTQAGLLMPWNTALSTSYNPGVIGPGRLRPTSYSGNYFLDGSTIFTDGTTYFVDGGL